MRLWMSCQVQKHCRSSCVPSVQVYSTQPTDSLYDADRHAKHIALGDSDGARYTIAVGLRFDFTAQQYADCLCVQCLLMLVLVLHEACNPNSLRAHLGMVLTSLLPGILKLTVKHVELLVDASIRIFTAWRQGQLHVLWCKAQRLQNVHLSVLQCTASAAQIQRLILHLYVCCPSSFCVSAKLRSLSIPELALWLSMPYKTHKMLLDIQ